MKKIINRAAAQAAARRCLTQYTGYAALRDLIGEWDHHCYPFYRMPDRGITRSIVTAARAWAATTQGDRNERNE